jgi:hypothetical protein
MRFSSGPALRLSAVVLAVGLLALVRFSGNPPAGARALTAQEMSATFGDNHQYLLPMQIRLQQRYAHGNLRLLLL